jgi:hypothetical protein
MADIRLFCDQWQFPATASNSQYIEDFAARMTISQLKLSMNQLRYVIEKEMKSHSVYYMTPDESGRYEMQEIGRPFSGNDPSFPSAAYDMREANSCYAVSRYTASVFHCMRVLEYGLVTLATNVGEDASYANWKTIIDRIEKKIRETRESMHRGDAKEARMKFLAEAAKEFLYFKDGWRNHVAHAKSRYDGPQALSAISHTYAFMNHLSIHLREIPGNGSDV